MDEIFPHSNMGWLRETFQPIGHIAHSHLVYEIAPDQYQHIIQDQPQYFPAPTQLINERDVYFILNNWQASNLERLGNNRDALMHYRKMAAHAPFDPQPLRGLIRNYQVLGETQAADRYQQALHRLIFLEQLYQQGFAANGEKDFTEAYDFFAAVTRQQPDYKLALFYQGLMLQMQGRHAESIPYYRRFQDLYPAYYQNLFNLAFALMKIGDCGQTVALFNRTLQLKPDYAEVHNYLSECARLSSAD